MLDFPPDISFVIQIVSFIALSMGLKRLILDPTLRVIEERERRTAGTKHEAAEMLDGAKRDAGEYEQRMQQARIRIAAETEGARTATEAAERDIQAEARQRSGDQLAELRARLATQAEEARQILAAQAGSLAGQMFERVVGRAHG